MRKTDPLSVFEVWDAGYLNYLETREEDDKEVRILQAEMSHDGEGVLVEVVRRKKED